MRLLHTGTDYVAVACVNEGQAHSEESIKEYMNGNICRCGAYNGIVNAIKEVAAKINAACLQQHPSTKNILP